MRQAPEQNFRRSLSARLIPRKCGLVFPVLVVRFQASRAAILLRSASVFWRTCAL